MSLLRKPTAWYRATVATDGGVVVPPEIDAPDAERSITLYNGSNVDCEFFLLPDALEEVDFAGETMSALEAARRDANLRSMDALTPTLPGGLALPYPLRIQGRQAIFARAVRETVDVSVAVEYWR